MSKADEQNSQKDRPRRPVVVVTGASSGIGAECVRVFASAGWGVVAVARREDRLQKMASEAKASCPDGVIEPIMCDVNSEAHVDRVMEKVEKQFGRLDALINNAGYGVYGTVEETSLDRFRENMETNFFGVLRCTQKALPLLKAATATPQKGFRPAVVMVSSFVGRRSFPGMTSYCASKFALEGLSEGLRLELSEMGISVSVVNPGVTRTEFFEASPGERPPGYLKSDGGMPPQQVARTILKAVYRPRRNVYLSVSGKAGILLNWLSPRIFDWVIKRTWKG